LDSDVELVSANKYLESGGDEDESEDGENNEGEEEGSEEALQKLDDEPGLYLILVHLATIY
jgi:hypothetical protein